MLVWVILVVGSHVLLQQGKTVLETEESHNVLPAADKNELDTCMCNCIKNQINKT